MRILFLILAFAWTAVGYSADKNLTGVFSNNADGFKIVTVMIHPEGLAYFHAAVAGQIGEWNFDEGSSTLSIKLFDPNSLEDQSFKLKFDPKARAYQIIIGPGKPREAEAADRLNFVSDEIPQKMLEAFEAYPERMKEIKAQALAERGWKKHQAEQFKAERPEYERVLAQIRKNPQSVLSKEFHVREVTPSTRAFQESLKDKDTKYPEEVLVGLLEQLPDDNHWIRAMIFARPELQARTLTKFYPQALKWGELNYTILANIAKHPNTPIETVRDLAGRDDLPIGATNPAKDRLKKREGDQRNQ